MIPQVLLSMLLAAPSSAPPPNPNVQRLAFSRCLGEVVSTDLRAGVEPAAFRAKLPTLCKEQEEAFRQASVRSDLAIGIKAAAAQQNAANEIKDIVDTQAERYAGYAETKTLPKQ